MPFSALSILIAFDVATINLPDFDCRECLADPAVAQPASLSMMMPAGMSLILATKESYRRVTIATVNSATASHRKIGRNV